MKLCYRVVFFGFSKGSPFVLSRKQLLAPLILFLGMLLSEGCLSCTADLLRCTPASHWPADNPRHTTETTQDETGFAIVVNAKSSRLWL